MMKINQKINKIYNLMIHSAVLKYNLMLNYHIKILMNDF